MTTENAAPLVAQQKPRGTENGNADQSSDSMHIVSKKPSDVKVLLDMIKRRHIPMMDMLEVVQTIYPRCDKSLLSKCAHGEETGAKLRDDAMRSLMVHFREDGRRASPERRRKKPNRLVCRVTDAVYEALQRRLRQNGRSVQDYLEALVLADLRGENNEQIS